LKERNVFAVKKKKRAGGQRWDNATLKEEQKGGGEVNLRGRKKATKVGKRGGCNKRTSQGEEGSGMGGSGWGYDAPGGGGWKGVQ